MYIYASFLGLRMFEPTPLTCLLSKRGIIYTVYGLMVYFFLCENKHICSELMVRVLVGVPCLQWKAFPFPAKQGLTQAEMLQMQDL